MTITALMPPDPGEGHKPSLLEMSVVAAIACFLVYQSWGFFTEANTSYRRADRDLMTALVEDLRAANKQQAADGQELLHEIRLLRDEVRQLREVQQ